MGAFTTMALEGQITIAIEDRDVPRVAAPLGWFDCSMTSDTMAASCAPEMEILA
ncbi:hypothetical protein [Rhizobium sp. NFR12]|uniref:hypothetical protein n=1 Tax=Rhizobium/Agrobacterium group TaxID=227290 RepID=UPI0013B0131E|nr:hypothetical protein [Rhizobium sp. NFR12]